MSATALPEAVADADDPSLRFVYLLLAEADEWVTDEELRERTCFSQKTVQRCTERLADAGLAERRHRLDDARLLETRLTEDVDS